VNVVPLNRDPERFVTARELAGIMHVGERTVARWVAEGCPSETWGQRSRRFLPSEVMAWAKRRNEAA
jgi:predicted DNA-binding transcriptional regulator AlpA